MRITNTKHVPWFIFVVLATFAACLLYVGNFHADRLPAGIRLPEALLQKPSDHHSIGGTPLGLTFGSISLAIFIFAALLSVRKKIVLWRIGTVQRWLRAHIWLTFLTIPLIILHSGFRLGGPMTTLLMALYAVVMVSGIYGLILQHHIPRLMKERLPAETVFEQIPHIRAQLRVAAEKMRDSFKPAPPKKTDAGAPAANAAKAVTAPSAAMASTAGSTTTPAARAKTAVGSAVTAASVTEPPPVAKPADVIAANAAAAPTKAPETIGTPTARVQSDPPGEAVPRASVPAGDQASPAPPVVAVAPASTPPASTVAAKPAAPAVAKAPAKPVVPAKPVPVADPESEAALIHFIESQILPYLSARRGDKLPLGEARFAEDTFRFVKLQVAEAYRSRVEEIQAWCDERRMLDLQTRLQHWLHGWLFLHVPVSFLLLMLTVWHACVTLFRY